MFKKIMVPLDGSELAEKALPTVVNLVKQLDGSLILLSVVEPGMRYVNPFDTDLALADESAAIEDAERYLDNIRHTITEFGGLAPDKVRGIVTVGQPVEQITDLTPFEEVDLLIMTTHARTGISRLVMGSIATGVVRLLETPVILLRPEEHKGEVWSLADTLSKGEAATEAPRIIVTLDGSAEAEPVIGPASELAATMGATVYLVRVEMPPIPVEYGNLISDYGAYYGRELAQENKQRREEAYQYLDKVQAAFLAKGANCVKVVRFGQPPDQIIECATEINASMIVMATHARGRIGQFMLGSVAEEVMRRSHLPVMLVHTNHTPKKDKSTTDRHPAIV